MLFRERLWFTTDGFLHRSLIQNKIFVSQPDLFLFTTVKSIVKTKHLEVLLHNVMITLLNYPAAGEKE